MWGSKKGRSYEDLKRKQQKKTKVEAKKRRADKLAAKARGAGL